MSKTSLLPFLLVAVALGCGDAQALTHPETSLEPPRSEPGVPDSTAALAARDTVVITDTLVVIDTLFVVDTVQVAVGPSLPEVDSLMSARIEQLLGSDPVVFSGGVGWGGGGVLTTSEGLDDPLSDQQIDGVTSAVRDRILQGESLTLPGALGWGGGAPIGSSAHLVASLPDGAWGIGTSSPRGRFDVQQGEIWNSDGPFTLRTSGSLVGENPAGVGLYLNRRSGIGKLPLAVTFQQSGFNRWGVGMDEDTNDPSPDFISVFESDRGDIFRFRSGGRAILGNGIGRPEPQHILTLADRENFEVENVLNLERTESGSSTRFIRALDRSIVQFAVSTDGRVGVGSDVIFAIALNVNGRARATAFETISDLRYKDDVRPWTLAAPDAVLDLEPVRFTWNAESPDPGREDVGLVAQQVRQVLPELVHEDVEGRLSVDYAKVSVALVSVVRDQQERLDEVEARLARLEQGGGLRGGAPLLLVLAGLGLGLTRLAGTGGRGGRSDS